MAAKPFEEVKQNRKPRNYKGKWFDEIEDSTFVTFQAERASRGESMIPNQCICDRKCVKIFCTGCKNVVAGRIDRPCPAHPNVIFLQDFKVCSKCLDNPASVLIEIDDDTLDQLNKK